MFALREVGSVRAARALRGVAGERRLLLVVVLIAVVGLVVRVVYALTVVGRAPLVGDGLEFDGLARALADGRGYVTPFVAPGHAAVATAHKPPLYPMALALVSVFGGPALPRTRSRRV